MATIKQFTVTVTDVSNKDYPFVRELVNVRAKSKAEAADEVWARLESELFMQDGTLPADFKVVKKLYKLNVDMTRMLQATGYQTRDKRDAARKKAAAKKAAAKKAANPNGAVRKSHI